MVGYHQTNGSGRRAFVVENSGAYNLDVSGAEETLAHGKNSGSLIAGQAIFSGTSVAVLWNYSGSGSYDYTLLTAPSGEQYIGTVATDANDSGMAAGYAITSTGYVAVYWPDAETPVILNDAGEHGIAWNLTQSTRMNANAIVGWGSNQGAGNRAWVY